ncbi:hypothetical protein V6Z12_D12G067700 [Gossypium hirsutum]
MGASESSLAAYSLVFLELLSVYRDWLEEKAQTICKKQEDIEYKIEVADALATSPKFKPLSFPNEDCFTTFSRSLGSLKKG